jgi:hypothetical protein
LKIPKGQSESVYRRSTGNTMAKRKSTKGQTTISKTYKCIYRTKDRVTRTPLKTKISSLFQISSKILNIATKKESTLKPKQNSDSQKLKKLKLSKVPLTSQVS